METIIKSVTVLAQEQDILSVMVAHCQSGFQLWTMVVVKRALMRVISISAAGAAKTSRDGKHRSCLSCLFELARVSIQHSSSLVPILS